MNVQTVPKDRTSHLEEGRFSGDDIHFMGKRRGGIRSGTTSSD